MGLQALAGSGIKNPRANKVDLMLLDMSTEQVDLFRAVIRDELSYSAPAVAEALRADGFDINGDQIRHYRRKLREGSATL